MKHDCDDQSGCSPSFENASGVACNQFEANRMNNFIEKFESPEKLSNNIIEHDLEAELMGDVNECLRVYSTYHDDFVEPGRFSNASEFESWLCSDLPYLEWKKQHTSG